MAKSTSNQYSRVVLKLELTTSARDRLLGLSDDLGILQIAVTSRVIEWFAAQDSQTQASILGLYPGLIEKDTETLILEKMRKG